MAWFRCMGGSGSSSGGAEALIDHTQDVAGWIFAASPGDLRSSTTWTATQYIPVVPGETLQMAIKGASQYNGWYSGTGGTAGEYVGNFTSSSDGWITVTVPAGANYLRMSAENADIGGIQIWRMPAIGGDGEAETNFQADTSGWYGTAGETAERDMITITASGDTVVSFGSGSTAQTNCSNNEGFVSVKLNGTPVYTLNLAQSVASSLAIPDVIMANGDVLTIALGFSNDVSRHTNVNLHIYNGKIIIKGKASIHGITGVSSTSVTII